MTATVPYVCMEKAVFQIEWKQLHLGVGFSLKVGLQFIALLLV